MPEEKLFSLNFVTILVKKSHIQKTDQPKMLLRPTGMSVSGDSKEVNTDIWGQQEWYIFKR